MKHYEYLELEPWYHEESGTICIKTQELNAFGQDGWRVVSVVWGNDPTPYLKRVLLEREL
ncbi:MAG: hypothetical protein WC824_06025 [Bacteroidota bacterium]|jgi:hypothetical protein